MLMDLTSFTAEALNLARSGTVLREQGDGEPAAYWHGLHGTGPCFSFKHADKWVNVSIDGDGEGGSAEVAGAAMTSGTPLYAETINSLPPVYGVFLLGSEAVGEMLAAHDWPRNEPFNSNFPDPVPEKYETVWQNNCPMYLPDIAIAMGGWHFPWPDSDWNEYVDKELVAWSLKDAEPWVEVFCDKGEYIVKQRIT